MARSFHSLVHICEEKIRQEFGDDPSIQLSREETVTTPYSIKLQTKEETTKFRLFAGSEASSIGGGLNDQW